MKWSELTLLAVLAIFAGVLLKDSLSLTYSSDGGFGPGFIPLNFAIATILLACLLGAQSVFRGRAAAPDQEEESQQASFTALVAPVATMALLFVATFAMEFGSVLAPLAVVTIIVSAVFLKHSWAKAVGLTAVTLVAIYTIFSLWLNIPVT